MSIGEGLSSLQRKNLWVEINAYKVYSVFGYSCLDRSQTSKTAIGEYLTMFEKLAKKLDKQFYFMEWVPGDEECELWFKVGTGHNEEDNYI